MVWLNFRVGARGVGVCAMAHLWGGAWGGWLRMEASLQRLLPLGGET